MPVYIYSSICWNYLFVCLFVYLFIYLFILIYILLDWFCVCTWILGRTFFAHRALLCRRSQPLMDLISLELESTYTDADDGTYVRTIMRACVRTYVPVCRYDYLIQIFFTFADIISWRITIHNWLYFQVFLQGMKMTPYLWLSLNVIYSFIQILHLWLNFRFWLNVPVIATHHIHKLFYINF